MSGSPDASGPDPMHLRRMSVDEAHAMTTALRYSHHGLLDELAARAAGRFGREARTIAYPNPDLTPSRTTEVERMRERLKKSGYQIDNTAVATAILERLAAGGLALPAPKH